MSSSNCVEIEVSGTPWAETPKSWRLLTQKSPNGKGWSGGVWFPKNICEYNGEKNSLVIPRWFYETKIKEGIILNIKP